MGKLTQEAVVRRAGVLFIALITALAACVPAPATPAPTTAPAPPPTPPPTTPPTTPPGPGSAPVISAFGAVVPAGSAPVTTALTWSISDPDGDPLTCFLDLDGNGILDTTVTACTSASMRTASFASAGTRTLRLDVTDGSSTTTALSTVTVGTAGADGYAVTVRLVGTMTSNQQAAFASAAARWAQVVKGGLPDGSLNIGADDCLDGMPAFSGTIDDLLIDAKVTAIDGPGGILASAGPCYVRSAGGLPIYGVMQYDSADLASLEASGQLETTILHEMGHVLGIGTIWTMKGLLSGGGGSDPRFSGTAARGSWHALGGANTVPVENSGGPGTRDGHWRESTFDTELMTGWLDSGTNAMSRLTVASLGDLGYSVDLSAADGYTLPGSFGLRAFGWGADDHDHDHVDLAAGEQLITPRVVP